MSNTLSILFLEMAFARIQMRLVQLQTSLSPRTQRECAVSWVWPTTTDDLYRVSPNLLPLSINSCTNVFGLNGMSQNAFDALKHALVTAPVLAFPDFSQPTDLYVDASLEGIGMTLGQTQKGHEVAITYAGHDLTHA